MFELMACTTPPADATTYTYNAEGDRTGSSAVTPNASTTALGYDQADRLTSLSVTPVTGNATTATYTYNGNGLRASKTVNSGSAEGFVWDQAGSLPLLLVDGTTSFVYGPGGLPLEQVSSTGTVTWLHHDQLGSTVALTDATGNLVGTYAYSAYGAVTRTTGTSTTPLQFASGYADAESGLEYLINRYYDPATAQFLTVDPTVSITWSAYGYGRDNPTTWTDRSGLSAEKCSSGGIVCLSVSGKGEQVNGITAKFDVPLATPSETFIGYRVGVKEVLPNGQVIFRESSTYTVNDALFSPTGLDVVDVLPPNGLRLPDGTKLTAFLEDPKGNIDACTGPPLRRVTPPRIPLGVRGPAGRERVAGDPGQRVPIHRAGGAEREGNLTQPENLGVPSAVRDDECPSISAKTALERS